jgi:hypothetical protein
VSCTWITRTLARVEEIRPARFYDNYLHGYFSRLTEPRLSPVWVVPTRHPDALRQALKGDPSAVRATRFR